MYVVVPLIITADPKAPNCKAMYVCIPIYMNVNVILCLPQYPDENKDLYRVITEQELPTDGIYNIAVLQLP